MARILVIEDNPANLDLMTYLLQAFGHSALAAMDGEQGVEKARQERPDAILCDINLPRKDGYAVVRDLKGDGGLPHTPLIAITALAMVGDREKILAAGFDGCITKPIDPQMFVSQVEAFLPADTYTRMRPDTAPVGAASVAGPDGPAHATLLVVDDAPVNLELMRSIFIPLGYRVVTARSATEALAIAGQSPPDLIISDLHMPEMDGFGFIKAVKLRPSLCRVPFVFLSSTGLAEAGTGMALGADSYMTRPIDPSDLVGKIEQCLRKARQT
jgi:two-component system cell cycle response regulator